MNYKDYLQQAIQRDPEHYAIYDPNNKTNKGLMAWYYAKPKDDETPKFNRQPWNKCKKNGMINNNEGISTVGGNERLS